MLKHFSITLSVLLLTIIIVPGTKAFSQCSPPNPFLTKSDCISWSGGNTVHKSVAGKNWSWSCGSFDRLKLDVFNHTSKQITKVVFTESKTNRSWSKLVSLYPNNSVELESGYDLGLCKVGASEGYLKLHYYEATPKVCVKKRYVSKEEQKIWQEAREMEYETCIAQEIIYDNCVISKSKGQLKSTLSNIRSSCRVISKNPSFFEKLRWGR